jgi:quercetin dioxygenase-like cupin family protein
MPLRSGAEMALTRRGFLALASGTAAGLIAACATQPSAPAAREPLRSYRPPKSADLWNGSGLDARVLFQREVDRLPDAPHMLRVTELEMAPGASIDPHSHLGPGVQVVLSGAVTVIDSQTSESSVYEPTAAAPFPVYYSGLTTRYSIENRGPTGNRLFMTEILPRSRGFLGNQQFDMEGVTHNQGGVRSGPYVQVPLERLPEGPLMVRVSQIDMGPKAFTPEYTRPGPGLFLIVSGQATFRRQADLVITTNGAGGYFFEDGSAPTILENKPNSPNRIVAIEFLPASLGTQPSTMPTGGTVSHGPG